VKIRDEANIAWGKNGGKLDEVLSLAKLLKW